MSVLVFLILVGCANPQNLTVSSLPVWKSLNSFLPTHVPVTGIAVSASEPKQVFAAAYDRVGVYTSPDGLSEWQPDDSGLPAGPAFALLATPGEMFAGTAAGLYRRAYSAHDWQRADPIPRVAIYALAQDSTGALYVATDGRGIWKSDDSGSIWTRVKGLDDEPLTRLLPLNAQSIFAGTAGHGLLFTRDGGQTWNPIAPFRDSYINLVAHDPRDSKTLYVAPRGGLYRSRDGGLTWQSLGGGIEREIVRTLLVDPGGKKLLAGTSGRGMWVSQDGGEAWEQLRNPDGTNPFPPGRGVLTITARGDDVLVGTEDGVVRSFDAGFSWTRVDTRARIGAPMVFDAAFAPTASVLWLATQDGLYAGSPDLKRVSITGNDAPTTAVAIAPNDAKRIYAGTDGKGVFVSDDAGATWSAAGGELGGKTHVAQLMVDPTNADIVFARILFERIYKSIDGGDSWHTVWTGMEVEDQIQSVAIAPNNPTILYAGGDNRFFYSGDSGETWLARGLNGITTLEIWIDPLDANRVWAGATDGLYRSDDAGQSWSGPMLEGKTVSALARDGRGTFYIGTKYNGLFTTTAAMDTFTPMGKGLEKTSVNNIALDEARGVLYAITGDGLYCLRISAPRSNDVTGESCL